MNFLIPNCHFRWFQFTIWLLPLLAVGLAVGLVVGLVVGCQANKHPELRRVQGTVTYQTLPVAGAVVAFYHQDSLRPAVGATDEAGNFHLTSFDDNDGALPGEHTIVVTKTIIPDDDSQLSMDDAMKVQRSKVKSANLLPKKYATPKTSPLKLTVADDGKNDFTIELNDDR